MDTPTLGKFFTLHFLLPFVIAILALIHILFLHDSGSSSQLQTICLQDQKYLFSYYAVKDLLGMLYLVLFLAMVQSTQLNVLHLVLNSYFVAVFILLG